MVKAAVILSGCGYLDGAEIRESVLALLALDQQGAEVHIFAPDIAQMHVVDHVARSPVDGTRNVLQEAARIARSDVKALSLLDMKGFDLLVIPGGFGVAKNLSDLAIKGAQAAILPDFQRVIDSAYAQKKPIAAICIAPAVLSLALKNKGITVTIGEDAGTAEVIQSSGNNHQNCASDSCVVDDANHIVTCSAYMREDTLSAIAKGIDACIRTAVTMAKNQRKVAA
ncbi:MAG: isoprenoid biosynthesis glyoxalase ElbB [Alphaproteobacteria bacterium]|nr:isoprenoid biosynthesis glyoxalase ElbB [Alphaproteobacteria bacterium]